MNIDFKKFGLLLKQSLKSNHETQAQLAQAINVSQSTISKVVNGMYSLTPELATSIANHFPENIAMTAMLSQYMPLFFLVTFAQIDIAELSIFIMHTLN